ncbi:MAG: hypothetical protein Q7S31_03015 [bacterium]|nr:hypothetical protein [bacterium]
MWESAGRYLMAADCALGTLRKKRGTKFRVACEAALTYVARQQEQAIDPVEEDSLGDILALGIIANNHYDLGELAAGTYRQLRRRTSLPDYRQYFANLRMVERNRPDPGVAAYQIIKYREQVNAISLAMSVSAVGLGHYEEIVDPETFMFNPDVPRWIRGLFFSVMALQVVDDQVGWRGDSSQNRPSFYTAFKSDGLTHEQIMARMNQLKTNYLAKAKQISVDLEPIIFVSQLSGFLPQVIELTRKLRAPGLIASHRDAKGI